MYAMKKILFSCLIFTTPLAANAAGFALIEQSASGMGNAFAGGGAVAEDASTIYFNPAGMTYIEGTQLVGALHLIKPNVEFNDNGSVKATGVPPLGGTGGDAGDLAFVPNAYFKMDYSETIKLGIGLNAPFGLKTEYDSTWAGRFQAIKSEFKTININPALALKVNDQLSIGAGISAMWAQATLSRAVNRVIAGENTVHIKGDDWGFGYNLGAIFQATPDSRISFAYRSKVNQQLEGDATFGDALAANNTTVKASIVLPETLSISAFSKMNDTWDVMGDVTWTHWSRFKELRIDFANALPDSVTTENWDNTMRYSIGANYHYSDTIKLRAGLAYDEEAISDEFRTARIPGNDRKWISVGANWKLTENSFMDVGYSHLFISSASINDNQSAPAKGRNGILKGSYNGRVDILSLQYTHNF